MFYGFFKELGPIAIISVKKVATAGWRDAPLMLWDLAKAISILHSGFGRIILGRWGVKKFFKKGGGGGGWEEGGDYLKRWGG